MTDHHDPLDDLASAHVDGRTTAAEAARIDADPDLAARVDRFRAARDALQRTADEPIDAERREQAIAAALAAFDDGQADPAGAPAAVAGVSVLATRRHVRRRLRLVGIAAAVALFALALPLLGRLDPGSDDRASFEETAGPLDQHAATESADGGAVAGSTSGEDSVASTMRTELAALPHLGAHDDIDALTDTVRARLASAEPKATAPAADREATCDASGDSEGTVRDVAYATLRGQEVLAVVVERTTGGLVLVVRDASTCALVETAPL